MRRAVAIAAATASVALSPTFANGEPAPLELVLDGANGILEAQAVPRVCPELTGGTAGLPEGTGARGGVDRGNGLAPGAPTNAPAALPERLYLRSTTETFNRRYWFALYAGRIYFRSNAEQTGIDQPWAPLPTPDCFDGDVRGVSADDDEMIAIDSARQIYTMDGALGDPSAFNWTVRWGPLFWTGGGRTLPRGRDWEWSVSSPLEDGTFTDPAGNAHPVGDAKVSHAWLLNGHGQRLTYMDPWLPADQSYETCGPHRGRFRSVAMAASGSTVFVINRFGDMFTRLYDFDISGPDSFFVDYSYVNQRGAANPVVQLPPERWTEQPKIPGRITSAISIEKQGAGSIHRILRVAGRHNGRSGYWQRDIASRLSAGWRFVATDAPPAGRPLANPAGDSSRRGLGPSEDRPYVTPAGEPEMSIDNFNVYCSPARLVVNLGKGTRLTLRLHTTDEIRQSPRARGLDAEPRLVNGTIEAPARVLSSSDPGVRAFVNRYLTGGRFTAVRIDATGATLEFPQQGWKLVRVAR